MLLRREIRELLDLTETTVPDSDQRRYNGAPGQDFVVCRLGPGGERIATMLRWGLVPFWSRQRSIGTRLINARSETLAIKPSFRAAYRQRRCLVPVNGWFEWQRTDSGRQPYYIVQDSGSPTVLAGLWERWSGGDAVLETFTVITRDATADLAAIHHRQPVVIGSEDFAAWLHPGSQRGVVDRILVARPPRFQFRPISNLVNNPRNDQPEILDVRRINQAE